MKKILHFFPCLFVFLTIASLTLWPQLAYSHKPSDAYLNIDTTAGPLRVRLDVALRDLDALVPLDVNGDGQLTWGEIKTNEAALRTVLSENLHLTRQEKACSLVWQAFALEKRSDGIYLVAQSAQHCGQSGQPIAVRYQLLRDIDATHRAILTAKLNQAESNQIISRILDPNEEKAVLIDELSSTAAFVSFVKDGIHHILIGYDHVVFLLILLSPLLLSAKAQGIQVAIGKITGTVTAFTVAHSITLALAVLEILDPPSIWVELSIAVTIFLAALNNIKKFLPGPPAVIAFTFGLIHGFGFAGALREAALPQTAFGWALLGFNVGVELGQLLIVAIWLILVLLFKKFVHSSLVMSWSVRSSSAAVMVLATVWIIQRIPQ